MAKIDLDAAPFAIDRGAEPSLPLHEQQEDALKDFSKLGYVAAFQRLYEQVHREYAFAGIAGKEPDWAELYARTEDPVYLEAIGRSLRFLAAAQFGDQADDPNVRGALWETLNVPDGTTRPGHRVRDIASIFAVRAYDRLIADQLAPDDVAPLDNAMPW